MFLDVLGLNLFVEGFGVKYKLVFCKVSIFNRCSIDSNL